MLNLGVSGSDAAEVGPTGGAIGHAVLAYDLKAAVPALEAAGVEVLVLRFSAGMELGADGGLRPGTAAETEELVELIITELNPRFRTVAWVESALDTAAVAAWACEDLYFMSAGNLGAAVLEVEPMKVAKGEELAAWLRLGERASGASGRSPAIMRSMQEAVPLSGTEGPDGTMAWSNDVAGEKIVQGQGRVLTLNSHQADRLRISAGTADSRDELVLGLGLRNAVWVAEDAAAAVDRAQRSRVHRE